MKKMKENMSNLTSKINSANKEFRESKYFGYLLGACISGFVGTYGYAKYKSNEEEKLEKGKKIFQNDKKNWEAFKYDRLKDYGFTKEELLDFYPITTEDSLAYFENKCYEGLDKSLDDTKDTNRKKFWRNKMIEIGDALEYAHKTVESN